MRIIVAAVGRLKSGPETELADRYQSRAVATGRALGLRGIDIIETRESKAADTAARMTDEAGALSATIPDGAVTCALDERGDRIDSAAFASLIAQWRAAARPAAVFMIGGADGLSRDLVSRANHRIAFGAMTWPHQMVRVMLLEQIYRATTILTGHPYHRA